MRLSAASLFWAFFSLGLSAYASPSPKMEGNDLRTGKVATIELAQASKGTVFAFLSAKCPCSASHESVLESLRAKYEPLGFRFYGIHANQDEPAAMATEHFRASALTFPILTDSGAKIADDFGALKTPHIFVVNPKGEILYQGGVDDSHQAAMAKRHYLADALDALASGRSPETTRTRSLGCVISRK